MDDQGQGHSQHPSGSGAQRPYGSNPNQITGSRPRMLVPSVGTSQSTGQPGGADQLGQHQLAHQQHIHQQQQHQQLQQQLQLHQGQGHSQHPSGSRAQRPYRCNPYQITGSPGMFLPSVGTIQSTSQPGGADQLGQHQHQLRQQQQQQLKQKLEAFWENQRQEIKKVNDFKNNSLPTARIKKIMQADPDVNMIAAEAPILLAKACELFIKELTVRSWNHTEENRRGTLQKSGIEAALSRTKNYDFLADHLNVPMVEDLNDEVGPADGLPYCHIPLAPQIGTSGVRMGNPNIYAHMPPQVGTSGVRMGNPVMDPNMYAQQSHMLPQNAPQVGTAGVIKGNPVMDPNMYAQQSLMLPQNAPQVGTAGVIKGKSVMDPNMCALQSHPYTARQMWPQPPEQQPSSPTTNMDDFLGDPQFMEYLKNELLAPMETMPVAGPADGLPQVGTPGVTMENPVMDLNAQHSDHMPPQDEPQVGTPGVTMENPVMDLDAQHSDHMPSQDEPQVGTPGGIMENPPPVMDPNKSAKHSHP